MNGWIKLHRKITESPVFDNPNLLKLWLWCLCKATHTEHEVIVGKKIIKLLPGQFVFGRLKAADFLNMNDRTVYDYMKLLNKLEMISIKTNNKFTLVTIVNWTVYQSDANEFQQQNTQQSTIHTAQETAIENNTYNNEKTNDKEGKKGKEIIKVIRHKYGEYNNVLLSDSELEKLKSEFPSDFEERIENLSSYIASTGKTYKNHLATIRNWARKEKPKAKNRPDYYDISRYEKFGGITREGF